MDYQSNENERTIDASIRTRLHDIKLLVINVCGNLRERNNELGGEEPSGQEPATKEPTPAGVLTEIDYELEKTRCAVELISEQVDRLIRLTNKL